MKSRKILTSLLASASAIAMFSSVPTTVSAASNSSKVVAAKADKAVTIKKIPRLSKWDYVVTVNSDSQPISLGKANYRKMLKDSEFRSKNLEAKILSVLERLRTLDSK